MYHLSHDKDKHRLIDQTLTYAATPAKVHKEYKDEYNYHKHHENYVTADARTKNHSLT